ncbi:transporter substrate-binding domain-containing protein [Aestuariirhabdus sp. Z084]|uniref:substrate-binding periplasmic protein n=1 Tax=Aestuariirhabdus haliotis TaxID=2918751 RepID=UPI00201B366F|nr:transporter substrate-binding domain-containing protein [Aestuariirhabdus haliotis]MCL6415957.1 transporter substrate-binding domain-containing protein [Aestuariirhabdus haliotis]MCL6420010.1 transporter substrate-binding domain-containing protein [Aestuariirhabdus haliotis]
MRYLALIIVLLATEALDANEISTVTIVSDIWAPYVTNNPKTPGIDVETALAVFELMGIKVEYRTVPWKRAQQMVISGRADALLDASKNPKRLTQYWFPDEPMGYSVSTLFCFKCNVNTPISSELFTNKKLIINRGYSYASELVDDSSIQKLTVNSIESGIELLQQGRAGYYLLNRHVGLYRLKQLGITDIEPLQANTNSPAPLYLAFSRKSDLKTLSENFSNALKEFKKTQSYRDILYRYGIRDY